MRGSIALLALAACRFGFDETSSGYKFTDADMLAFDRGTYDTGSVPLAFRDGRVQLAGAAPYARADVGIYVSRVFDTTDPHARWTTLSWLGPAPQVRGLPANETADEGYSEGGVGMANNILLLHLDGAGATTNGEMVPDASGRLHHGEIVDAGQGARYTAGVIGDALDLDRDAWVTLDGNYFDYGTGDFTYAIWAKMFDCSQSNDNRIAIGGAGAGDSPHVWLGVLCPDTCAGRDGLHSTVLDATRTGNSVSTCSGVVLDDGDWHHLALVKRGHTPSATLSLFVDGNLASSQTFDYGGATFTYDDGEIRLGSFNLNDPQYHTRVVVDEAAIWKRALSNEDIAALHRRGAVRIELQFRACADGACDSEPFLGPDGTTATYFTEADLEGAPGSQQNNLASLGLAGALGQYRVRFSTAAAMTSPALLRVTVEAQP